MPRPLLRDGRRVDDDWTYHAAEPRAESDARRLIVPLDQWLAAPEQWLSWAETPARSLGILILPAHKVEQLAPHLARFDLIAAHFPGPSDGRGYTQGRLLRERYHFTGELRAAGYVRRDQLFFLARCGFNSFELPEGEFAAAAAAFSTFTAEYQPSNDEGLAAALRHR